MKSVCGRNPSPSASASYDPALGLFVLALRNPLVPLPAQDWLPLITFYSAVVPTMYLWGVGPAALFAVHGAAAGERSPPTYVLLEVAPIHGHCQVVAEQQR
jgi:hypothetical protein